MQGFDLCSRSQASWITPRVEQTAQCASLNLARRVISLPCAQPRLAPVHAFIKKSPCADGQITFRPRAVSRPQEGRIAIVTDVGRGMRWTRFRVADERAKPRTAKSCGPDA